MTKMEKQAAEAFNGWYDSLKRYKGKFPALGTIAGALVVLDQMAVSPSVQINDFIAEKGRSQIKGASGGAVKKILARFGETRPFLSEGGRTNRGLRGDIEKLLKTLDSLDIATLSESDRQCVIGVFQDQLVKKVILFHQSQRLKMVFDASQSIYANIASLLDLAGSQKKEGPVAQYLVGAKLQLRFPSKTIENETFSTSDVQRGRHGDFQVGDTAFHVTVSPMPQHFDKCEANIRDGIRPFLIVPGKLGDGPRQMVESKVPGKVTVTSLESFIAQNLEELSAFDSALRPKELRKLLEVYNARVDVIEIDKSLLVEIPANLH